MQIPKRYIVAGSADGQKGNPQKEAGQHMVGAGNIRRVRRGWPLDDKKRGERMLGS
jgi:hypothetical protein